MNEDRDFIAEMRVLIETELEAPSAEVPLLANDIVEKLEANDIDLLNGWLRTKARPLLGEYIRHMLSQKRALVRAHEPREMFGAHLAEFVATSNRKDKSGSPPATALVSWLTTKYHVGRRNLNLGDFTKIELQKASAEYSARASRNAFEASFLTALAKKLTGEKKVSDVFSNDQIDRIYKSLNA